MKYLITFSDIYRKTKVYISIAHLLSNVILTQKKIKFNSRQFNSRHRF